MTLLKEKQTAVFHVGPRRKSLHPFQNPHNLTEERRCPHLPLHHHPYPSALPCFGKNSDNGKITKTRGGAQQVLTQGRHCWSLPLEALSALAQGPPLQEGTAP